jgi:hypothetical protein
MKSKVLNGFLFFKSLLKQFSETSDLLKGGLEINSSYNFFPKQAFWTKDVLK